MRIVVAFVLGCGNPAATMVDAPARDTTAATRDATAEPACGLTDTDVHLPPASGSFGYAPPGTFAPDQAAFPAAGATYVDPVFGCTVRRLTDVRPGWGSSLIYSKNGFWNADGTHYANSPNEHGEVDIIDATTGAMVRANVPFTFDSSFDPVDPDVFYTFEGADLHRFVVSTGANTVIQTLPAPLENLGGSVDWIDRTGQHMLLAYGGELHIWDRETNTIYAGSIPSTFDSGWAGISPDGNYIIVGGNNHQEFQHWSFPIDHAARSIGAGQMFWSLCGPHSDIASTSDGKTYLIGYDCTDEPAIFRVDVSIAQTTDDIAKQKSDNVKLADIDWHDSGHFACAGRGDWCFGEVASGDDTFTGSGPWRPFEQEVVAFQVVPPFEVRRLAHHRSRSPFSNYVRQPRANASWDGNKVAFASDFGDGSDGDAVAYSDVYVISP